MEPNPVGKTTVQDLIRRIREDGVRDGREEAERLMREAREEAARLVEEARKSAEETRRRAAEEIARHREATLAALQQGARDTALELQERVASHFESFVRRFVTRATSDPAFLRELVLALAGRAGADVIRDRDAEIRLPEAVLSPDTEAGREFLAALSSDTLREGVSLVGDPGVEGGARVILRGEHLEIDLSAEVIARLISERLQPRFRAILEGLE
jgi:V/A-type H+-transporting ATPase subunit E